MSPRHEAGVDGPDVGASPADGGARQLHGVGVGRGVAVAPVVHHRPSPDLPPDTPLRGPDGDEIAADEVAERVAAAFDGVAGRLREQAAADAGTLGQVLRATAQIAEDVTLRRQVLASVTAGEAPIMAIDAAVDGFAEMFRQAGGYLAERVTDLHSVRDRVVARLFDQPEPGVPPLSRPSTIVARDLAPADTAALDMTLVAAIVTEEGGPTGHTAIIASQEGIPCLVRVAGATAIVEAVEVGVDAAAGLLTVDPGPTVRAEFSRRAEVEASLLADEAPGGTADGHAVALLGNIGTAQDAEHLPDAVEGVGLFRTEVLFLGRASAPDVEAQASAYAQALRSLGDRKLVVRTLDAGADKPLAFVTAKNEENPALGVRGYRTVRTHPELLDTQLLALARAAEETGRQPWVMAPMISTRSEAADFAERARSHGLETVGAMIEVPAAALRAEQILQEVDFVSIGTNDLAQYTMATDRLLGDLADLLDPFQPALLDLLALTSAAGESTGKPVGVCGASAGDPVMAAVLTGLGVTSLSMVPAALPAVRYVLRSHTRQQLRDLAAAARLSGDAAEARATAVAHLDAEVRATLGL